VTNGLLRERRADVRAAEISSSLVQTNDRLAAAARANKSDSATFLCECGNCLAQEVPLALEEHDQIRARDDLIFAEGHDGHTRGPTRSPIPALPGYGQWDPLDAQPWRSLLKPGLRTAHIAPARPQNTVS
jgi:hypothetical protein